MNMDKKMMFFVVLTVFLFVCVSFVSAVSKTSQEKLNEEMDSPLFNIRKDNAINYEEKTLLQNKIKNIITNFLETRIFLKVPLTNLFFTENNAFTQQPGCTYTKGLVCGPTLVDTCRALNRDI